MIIFPDPIFEEEFLTLKEKKNMLKNTMRKIKKNSNKRVKSNGKREKIKNNLVKSNIKNIKKLDIILNDRPCHLNIDVLKYRKILKEVILGDQ